MKEHYLKYIGGYALQETYQWKDWSETTINTLFLIKYKGFGLLKDLYHSLITEEKVLPEEIVSFATDDGGNFFYISNYKNGYGSIYYCNSDNYNTDNKEGAWVLVNENFNEFLNNCKLMITTKKMNQLTQQTNLAIS